MRLSVGFVAAAALFAMAVGESDPTGETRRMDAGTTHAPPAITEEYNDGSTTTTSEPDYDSCYRPPASSTPFESLPYTRTQLANGDIEFRCPAGYMTYGSFGVDGPGVFEVNSNVQTCDLETNKFSTAVQESALTTMSCVKNEKIINNPVAGLCQFLVRALPYIVLNDTVVHCGKGQTIKLTSGELTGQIVESITCASGPWRTKLANGSAVKLPGSPKLECTAAESKTTEAFTTTTSTRKPPTTELFTTTTSTRVPKTTEVFTTTTSTRVPKTTEVFTTTTSTRVPKTTEVFTTTTSTTTRPKTTTSTDPSDYGKCHRPEAPLPPFDTANYNRTRLANGTIEFRCPTGFMPYGSFGVDGPGVFEVNLNVRSCDPATGKIYTSKGQESALTTLSCVKNEKIINNPLAGLCQFLVRALPYIVLNNTVVHCGKGRALEIANGSLAAQIVPSLTCKSGTLYTTLSNGTTVPNTEPLLFVECVAEPPKKIAKYLQDDIVYIITGSNISRSGEYSRFFYKIIEELEKPKDVTLDNGNKAIIYNVKLVLTECKRAQDEERIVKPLECPPKKVDGKEMYEYLIITREQVSSKNIKYSSITFKPI